MIELCYSTDLERLNKTNYDRGDKSALISGASRSNVLFFQSWRFGLMYLVNSAR